MQLVLTVVYIFLEKRKRRGKNKERWLCFWRFANLVTCCISMQNVCTTPLVYSMPAVQYLSTVVQEVSKFCE